MDDKKVSDPFEQWEREHERDQRMYRVRELRRECEKVPKTLRMVWARDKTKGMNPDMRSQVYAMIDKLHQEGK